MFFVARLSLYYRYMFIRISSRVSANQHINKLLTRAKFTFLYNLPLRNHIAQITHVKA